MKLKKFNFKTVNSTNDLAHKILLNSKNKFGIVIAENQKKGRGQYGKKWISYKGNLFVSIFFPIDKVDLTLKQLTKINCLLIKKTISFFYNGKITLKKPNDLFANKRKISGILQETFSKLDEKFIIIGVGINLIRSPNLVNYPTISLLDLINIKINPNKAATKLIKTYEKYMPIIQKNNIKNIYKILK
jgi:BirA family biotin operon repressor/biotin-[acetyl-CoA-carboxylase] ligase